MNCLDSLVTCFSNIDFLSAGNQPIMQNGEYCFVSFSLKKVCHVASEILDKADLAVPYSRYRFKHSNKRVILIEISIKKWSPFCFGLFCVE